MGQFAFKQAVKSAKKARIALIGPSGAGKTWTALAMAEGINNGSGRIVGLDTERGSMSLYATQFDFDVLDMPAYSPETYTQALQAAAEAGYTTVIIDSLSHAWEGEGGARDQVDARKGKFGGNAWSAWSEVTPMQRTMVDAILKYPGHVIVTMRTKTEWVVDKDDRGKSTPRKVGLQAIQRAGIEYEFDVVGDLDENHHLTISKTRLQFLDGQVVKKPGRKLGESILADLTQANGAPAPEPETPAEEYRPADDLPAQPPPMSDGPDLGQKNAWVELLEQAEKCGKDRAGVALQVVQLVDANKTDFDLLNEKQAAEAIQRLTNGVTRWQLQAEEAAAAEAAGEPEPEPEPEPAPKPAAAAKTAPRQATKRQADPNLGV